MWHLQSIGGSLSDSLIHSYFIDSSVDWFIDWFLLHWLIHRLAQNNNLHLITLTIKIALAMISLIYRYSFIIQYCVTTEINFKPIGGPISHQPNNWLSRRNLGQFIQLGNSRPTTSYCRDKTLDKPSPEPRNITQHTFCLFGLEFPKLLQLNKHILNIRL